MDYGMIRARIEALCKLGGWSNSDPAPDYAFLANEGLRLFTQEAQHNVEDLTVTTVADQAEYSITDADDPRKWIVLLDDADYNGAGYLPQTTRDQLRAWDRRWRTRSSSTPKYWYWAGPQSIGLWPVPSTSDEDATFQGVRHEPELDADSDEPTVTDVFHEGICLYGAWHHGKLYARGDERAIAEGYLAEAKDYALRCKAGMNSQEAGLVTRTVQRPAQEYMSIGGMAQSVYGNL